MTVSVLQPVIVSNCNKYMNMDLWSPESFAKEFGHMENDLVNCNSGTLLVGNQMKVFWDGFENISGTAFFCISEGKHVSIKIF